MGASYQLMNVPGGIETEIGAKALLQVEKSPLKGGALGGATMLTSKIVEVILQELLFTFMGSSATLTL